MADAKITVEIDYDDGMSVAHSWSGIQNAEMLDKIIKAVTEITGKSYEAHPIKHKGA